MRTILVVDDEYPIRKWMVYVLGKAEKPSRVLSAQNGQSACDILQKEKVDLVITDIRMPQMDGLKLLEQMKVLAPNAGIIVLSSYDDFSYVRTAFKHCATDYLLKADITEEILLTSIEAFFARQQGQPNTELSTVLKQAITNAQVTAESLAEQCNRLQVFLHEGFCFLFLTKMDAHVQSELHLPTLTDLRTAFSCSLGDGVTLGCVEMGNICSSLLQLQQQSLFLTQLSNLNSITLLLASRIIHFTKSGLETARQLFAFSDIDFYEIKRLVFRVEPQVATTEYYQRYLAAMNEIYKPHAQQEMLELDAYFDFLKSEHYPKINLIKNDCIKLLETAFLSIAYQSVDQMTEFSTSVRNRIMDARTFDQLQKLTKQTLIQLYNSVETLPKTFSPRTVKAIRYMEERFMQPITLSMVAAEIHLNPEYFSRNFKQETGENFNTYLNKIRLKKAMLLVRDTDQKLSEIAQSCGFQSFAYFSKCFKSMFGDSPFAWRSMHGQVDRTAVRPSIENNN